MNDVVKVLITGGAGFIGHHLTRHLLKDAEILVIDNLFTGRRELLPRDVELKVLDIRSPEIKEVINYFKPDIVIHLAAIHFIPYCNTHPEETFDVNVMGTLNILKHACRSDTGMVFFFASTAAVYPPLDGPLSEHLEPNPIDIYGKTKFLGEKLTELMCEDYVIARIFNVYGENDLNMHIIPEIINQLKSGSSVIKLGNITPKRDFIHVEDVSRAITTLLKRKARGIFNIGSGKEYSVAEIVAIISEILGREIRVVQDVGRMRKVDRNHLLADISKIIELGWQPAIDLKEGLRRLLKHEGLI